MKKIGGKIFTVILCCSLISICLLGFISIIEATRRAKKDAETTLLWMARDYADKFSTELIIIEDKLDEMEHFITLTLDFTTLKKDRSYLGVYEQTLTPFVEHFANNRTKSIAGWVYFDPKWSDSPHDVYFVDGDGDGKAERQEYIPFEYYDGTALENDDKQWWYGTRDSGKTFWTNPYEWKLKNGEVIKVVSCARPISINGEFIGVVGTYYRFDDMYDEITSISVYQNGYAALFNEKLDTVIHPDFFAGTRFTSDNLQRVNNGEFSQLANLMLNTSSGVVPYRSAGFERIMAFAKLSNGWIMAITPPLREIYSDAYRLAKKLLLSIVFSLLISAVAAYFMGKYTAKPILQIADAAKRIGTGDFSARVRVNTEDETHTLAEALNTMAENIQILQTELIQQAYFDELTGSKNLRKFKSDAVSLLRLKPEVRYVLIKFDISKFKLLNEIYGFTEGDLILQNIAAALEKTLNPDLETFARVYSDEFVALVSYTEPSDIESKRQLFLKQFYELNKKARNYHIVFFEGRYYVEKTDSDITQLFEKVNLAHRIAKENGSGGICVYDDTVGQIAKQEREIESRMEQALADGEFKLYLQPKYLLDGERIVGAESLVRWVDNTGNITYPNSFIPIFERNGFIAKLDFYMLEQSCKILKELMDKHCPLITLSINFSRFDLNTVDFLPRINAIIDSYGIPRQYIEVELTETAMLYNIETFTVFLDSLHKAGLTLSMDDFGTGYSSLGLLKNLPVDVIKLDRSFFVDAEDESRAQIIIESVIAMTKKLGISTVAEGVEEKTHVEMLKRLGCDIVQGYYFAKPVPAADLVAVLCS